VRLRLAFEKAFVTALAEAGGGVHDELGVGGEGDTAVAGQVVTVGWSPMTVGVTALDLQPNQIMFAAVVTCHCCERFPIHALFINAQAAPFRFVLKNLMRELVDAGTGFARAGVAGDEPAATELVTLPDESAEFGNVMFSLWIEQQTDGHDHQQDSGVKPVELHTIRRQDPALARTTAERARIKQYRNAVEAAAAGKLAESFKRLDNMGAVVECGLGEQADKLADEYVRLAEQNASAVVVSQTWAEVHRVNSRVRDALKAKGLLGANDMAIQAFNKLDLTNAQKRDERFYPLEAVVVFNQKVREAKPGATGKLAGIVKLGVLVEVDGKFVTVSNKLLDRITVCQRREIALSAGDRLHLKANRKLATSGRVTNGELVAVKSVRTDGAVELADGRVLDKSFREFLPGYAVTSYGSQGKTVDHVLFSDSTIKAATNAQQWYVTISRGRRGIHIFTPDKQQLCENVTRSGHRALAIEFATDFVPRRNNRLWNRLRGYMLRFGRRAADNFFRLTLARRHRQQNIKKYEHKITRMLGE